MHWKVAFCPTFTSTFWSRRKWGAFPKREAKKHMRTEFNSLTMALSAGGSSGWALGRGESVLRRWSGSVKSYCWLITSYDPVTVLRHLHASSHLNLTKIHKVGSNSISPIRKLMLWRLHSLSWSDSQKLGKARHESMSLRASKSILLAAGWYCHVCKRKLEGWGWGSPQKISPCRPGWAERRKLKWSTSGPETCTPGLGDDAGHEGGKEGRTENRWRRTLAVSTEWMKVTWLVSRQCLHIVTHLTQRSRRWYYLYFTVSDARHREFKTHSESALFTLSYDI